MICNVIKNSFLTAAILGLLVGLMAGCAPGRSISGSPGGKLYETFYSGEFGTQYFIKPLTFVANDNSLLNVDFTFRYNGTDTSLVTVNYSVIANRVIKDIESMEVISDTSVIKLYGHRVLFNEVDKDGFESRFTTSMVMSDLSKWISEPEFVIIIHNIQGDMTFQSNRKTNKAISNLNAGLFQIFR